MVVASGDLEHFLFAILLKIAICEVRSFGDLKISFPTQSSCLILSFVSPSMSNVDTVSMSTIREVSASEGTVLPHYQLARLIQGDRVFLHEISSEGLHRSRGGSKTLGEDVNVGELEKVCSKFATSFGKENLNKKSLFLSNVQTTSERQYPLSDFQ